MLFIVLDDTGSAQFGSYYSPIKTPNLDAPAENGLRKNNMHNYLGLEEFTVTSTVDVPKGEYTLRYEFESTGPPIRALGGGHCVTCKWIRISFITFKE